MSAVSTSMTPAEFERELTADIGKFWADPLAFVLYAFPWGTGELEGHKGPDKWQTALLKRIGDKFTADPQAVIREVTASGHACGKALCNDTLVPTPDGFVRMGNLTRGMKVFGANGRPTTIMRVMPQGVTVAYRVTFTDRTSVVCNPEHVWTVRGRQQRRNGTFEWIQLTTAEIVKRGVKRPNGVAEVNQWEIPQQAPALFNAQTTPIDPYVLGVWLGDGDGQCGRVTKPEPEMWQRIEAVGQAFNGTGALDTNVARTMYGITGGLRELSLLGCKASLKFVPEIYKLNSPEVRAEILRGLLDTDGECTKTGAVVFGSTSKRLAQDVIWLARSLAGKATMHPTVKKPWYVWKGGRLQGQDFYRVTVAMPDDFQCFYISRKQERTLLRRSRRFFVRLIESIEPVEDRETTCIAVSNPDGLFQCTEDFIVTHNSALTSWIILWAMSTRPNMSGVVTANTAAQLSTKTWRELALWHKRAINAHWFKWSATKFCHYKHPETWFTAAIPNSERNSEAFAGLHAADVLVLFDEASAIPDGIWDVAEGALTTSRSMHFAFGNPTRNTGRFRHCFENDRRWTATKVDSRTCKIESQKELKEWIETYGEDGDFVRVRVKGEFPRAGSTQFIPSNVVDAAMLNEIPYEAYFHMPLVIAVDVARFGEDKSVIIVRQGRKILGMQKFSGKDTMELSAIVSNEIRERRPAVTFVDEVGVGGGVIDRLRMLNYEVLGVNAGKKADDPERFFDKRAEMWGRMKEWLASGADIPHDTELRNDLIGVEHGYSDKEQIRLERKRDMKKRGLASPDIGDALAYSFAEYVVGGSTTSFEPSDSFEAA